jgi:protein SCO1
MNIIKAAILLTLAPLSACLGPSDVPPPLEGARIGGPFTLIGETGKEVRDTDFAGKYRLIYFGYSFCPDVCPADVQRLMLGYSALERHNATKATQLQPLFITVDPERDTPAVLTTFTNAFHPKLIGLTGTAGQIAAVAKEYAVVYQKAKGATPQTYLMDHSRTAVLFDPKGAPLALIPQDGKPEIIAAELARWIK